MHGADSKAGHVVLPGRDVQKMDGESILGTRVQKAEKWCLGAHEKYSSIFSHPFGADCDHLIYYKSGIHVCRPSLDNR